MQLRVHRLPPPPQTPEEIRRRLEHFPRTVRVLLFDERHSAQVGDPAEPGFVCQLSKEPFALVEQASTFVKIGFVEAQHAKCRAPRSYSSATRTTLSTQREHNCV